MQKRSTHFLVHGFYLAFYFMMGIVAASLLCLLSFLLIVWIHSDSDGFILLIHRVETAYQSLSAILSIDTLSAVKTDLLKLSHLDVTFRQVLIHVTSGWIDRTCVLKLVSILLPYLKVIILSLQWILIRTFLFLHYGSYFALFGVVGIVDGVTQRHIRRAAVGRESAAKYHHAKQCIPLILMLSIFIVLDLPLSFYCMQWVLMLLAGLFGCSIQITIKMFKKYF